MKRDNLIQANKINDQIKTNDQVIEHLKRNSIKNDRPTDQPIDVVVKFLTECRNLGNKEIRSLLCTSFIIEGIKILEASNKILEDEIEKL